jgi:hypothetical protein
MWYWQSTWLESLEIARGRFRKLNSKYTESIESAWRISPPHNTNFPHWAEHWASILKVIVRFPPRPGIFFKPARCGLYTQSNITSISKIVVHIYIKQLMEQTTVHDPKLQHTNLM